MTKINWNRQLVNKINGYLKQGYNFPKIAKKLHKETGIHFNKDDVRLGYRRHTEWLDNEAVEPLSARATKKAFENIATAFGSNITMNQPIEIRKLSDGSYSSSRTLELTDSELKDENALLKYHGYDPDKWTIKTSSNSRNTRETNQGTRHSYNSRITVKPKTALTLEDVKNVLSETYVTPMEVYKYDPIESDKTLVVSLFDLHLGVTKKETIKSNLSHLIHKLEQGYNKVVIISGGDVLHSDVTEGNAKTTSGTLLDPTDMKQAVKDARSFYDAIFRTALANSNKVEHYAIGGNHDRTTSFMFYLVLKERFPQIKHVLDDYRLAFKLGSTGILVAHGDLAMKEIALLFATQYSEVWNSTKNHEVYSGHFHTQKTTDDKGVILRSFGTPKSPDGYEKRNGYLGNRKLITAIEYDESNILAQYYL